ncbi:MAG TPA: response regulator, partial [Anaerolineales bacterium]
MESISVLVVDDEPGIALLCNRVLSRAGYDVISETNPRTAIELLQQKRFDLLVVDIRMPEVDGFDVISRAQMIQPDIAVLVMTGFGTVETAIRALRQGVDGLLLKPFQKSDELLQAVRQAMTDNQRKRDTARVSALRPLFNVTERLFAETDRDRLLELIVSAVCEHLNCSNVAYYEVKNGTVSVVAQRGKVLQVDSASADSNFASGLISRVDADGNPFVINATGPGEEDAQSLLSSLGLGTAILIPVARSNLQSVLFAARDASSTDRPFRGADLEMFFVLARQAVVAMENASLYEDLRDYVRKVEDSQQALLRAEKMAAAGRLTASIAHEVNNPLESVQ